MSIKPRVKIIDISLLSDNWYILKKAHFSFRRADGTWQEQTREVYDRGNGACILLYNLAQRTVILTRQFRFPAFANGYDDLLIEAPAGLLDNMDAEARIKLETEEETGFRIGKVSKIFEAFMSPGSVTERLHFFIASYEAKDRVSSGGGHADEGEDIGVMEMKFDEAMKMLADGRIVDAKTIMLLQHAALQIFRN
jgi:nudix-type nucleoside diphosphatase (YffH/AdpP family)